MNTDFTASQGFSSDEKYVLLVEDNPIDKGLTLKALEKNNIHFKVVVAHDGEEAINILFHETLDTNHNSPNLPEIILLDLKLPKIDGLEIIKRIRSDQRLRLIPIIVLTSSTEERDLIESYSLGANSYIRKQIDFVQFIKVINQLFTYWLSLNEGPPKNARQ